MPSNENQSATQLPKRPYIPRPFSGPRGKLYKAIYVGVVTFLWCVPPDENERPLIVSTVLAMEEKQARFWKAVAMVKAKRAEEAKKKKGCSVCGAVN